MRILHHSHADTRHWDLFEQLLEQGAIHFQMKPEYDDEWTHAILGMVADMGVALIMGDVCIKDLVVRAAPSRCFKAITPAPFTYLDILPVTQQFMYSDTGHHNSIDPDVVLTWALTVRSMMN